MGPFRLVDSEIQPYSFYKYKFTGHKKVSTERVQWSVIPMGKTVLLLVIFLGSNVLIMLGTSIVVTVSHNSPTREKQSLSFIKNLPGSESILFIRIQFGLFLYRFTWDRK